MIYTEEYLKEVDNNIQFIPLTFDYAFKSIMMKNIDLFKDFLIKTMNLRIRDEDNYILFLDKELVKQNFKEHGKVIDLNVKIGANLLIDVEVNTSSYEVVMDRNELYLEKLHTLSFEVGEEYQVYKSKYIYQLNLNAYPYEDKHVGERVAMMYDVKNHKVFNSRRKIYIKNLVYYRNKYYNNGKLKSDEIFMAALTSRSFSELYNIMSNIISGDKLDKFIKDVIDMSSEWISIHEWEKEKMDKLVLEKVKEVGLRDGRKEGLEQAKLETVKNMLDNKLGYELISKVSGKSIEEIKKIEKSMN